MDNAIAQDLYHYALAMQGNGNSAFDAETLMDRLDAAKNAKWSIERLTSESWQEFDPVTPRPDAMRSTEDLTRVGASLQAVVEAWCARNHYDPSSGNKLS